MTAGAVLGNTVGAHWLLTAVSMCCCSDDGAAAAGGVIADCMCSTLTTVSDGGGVGGDVLTAAVVAAAADAVDVVEHSSAGGMSVGGVGSGAEAGAGDAVNGRGDAAECIAKAAGRTEPKVATGVRL